MPKRPTCKRGHPNTPENRVGHGAGKTRCRECSRLRDRGRKRTRTLEYWRQQNARRREQEGAQ